MKVLKAVFGFVWALYGFMLFMAVVIVLTIVYAIVLGIFGRKAADGCIWFNCHYVCPFLLTMYGIRYKVFNAEKIKKERTYVHVSNHLAQIDILANGSAVPHPIRFLAKAEIKYVPFFGYMCKMLAVLVDRKSRESREKSVQYMIKELKQGHSIFIYAEGTRNRGDNPLTEFKDGAFKMAIQAQVPLAVHVLVNTRQLNDPRTLSLLPGNIEIHYLDPIETEGLTVSDVPALKARVVEQMTAILMERDTRFNGK
jgi:1-acyl-sn-glycerol-3-phosphate acyltransferase